MAYVVQRLECDARGMVPASDPPLVQVATTTVVLDPQHATVAAFLDHVEAQALVAIAGSPASDLHCAHVDVLIGPA